MSELNDLTVCQSRDLLRSGQVSSRQLTEAALERIAALEPQLHVFITLTPELALQQADEADRRRLASLAPPPASVPPD